jgi:NAD(P)-dependent dehydrogenase (short-subunit alcohol dehydrogenase family)
MDKAEILDVRPSLTGKVAFVTGGLGGIGQACVKALVAHGCQVAFTYAEGHEPESRASSFVAQNPEHLSAHALSLQSAESIKTSLQEAMNHWGRIDILINNAAVGSATVAAYADDLETQDTAIFAINADGALKVCQTFLALQHSILETPLKIINVSSVGGGVQVFPGFRLSDGMSKAAVAFMTKQLAAQLTHSSVDVFAICPGATNTAMFQASTLHNMDARDQESFVQSLPKHRLIEPAEIANILVFLASSYSTVLHGAVIDASMGLGVRPGILTERNH